MDITNIIRYDQRVRTTLTIDDDVAALLQRVARRRGTSFKATVNDALRCGLSALSRPRVASKPYRVTPWNLGGSLVGSLDNVEEVLSRVEGEGHK
jgi:Arc/MetJ family transcription regulator